MLTVIIPTYNESEVILSTVKQVQKHTPKDTEILVCDDNSPDKTWELVKNARLPKVTCLRRTKNKGLTPAVIEGMQKARGERILIMDADGQHPPSAIPRLLAQDADFVIGSRFVKGGSVQGWSRKRLFMSRCAALLARPVLWQPVKDPMSGFFLCKKNSVQPHLKQVRSKGYKVLLELLDKAKKVTIIEVPFTFGVREHGASKLTQGVIFEFLKTVLRLGAHRYQKFLRFCIVGTTGVLVNSAILYALTEYMSLFYALSSAVAIEAAILNNFIWNNFWTWKCGKKNVLQRLWKFNITALGGLAINLSVLVLLTESGMWYMLANLFGIALGMLFNFFVNDKWTFKK